MNDQSELLLPHNACLLHVGPYKTGSSAIQFALQNAREEMGRYGAAYPGSGQRAKRSGWGVMGTSPRGWEPGSTSDWEQLLSEVHAASDQRVCVSTEDFARATPKQAMRIVDDLGADRVFVVAVSRRLDRLLPSAWQQRVQSFATVSYEEFLGAVLDTAPSDHPLYRSFWASHDAAAMIERWTSVVGKDRFALVVTADTDRNLLPRAFEQMLGLPEGTLKLDAKSNPSLSMNATELLLRMNRVFDETKWPDAVYHQVMRRGAVPAMKYGPRSDRDTSIPPMPRWAAERVAELSAQRVQDVAATGVRIVGDLDNLRTAVPDDAPDAVAVPGDISLESAVQAVRGAVEGALALQAKERRKQAQAPKSARTRRTPPPKVQPRPRPKKDVVGPTLQNASTRELLGVVRRRVVGRVRRLGPGAEARRGK